MPLMVIEKDGVLYADSRNVAQMVEKKHHDLLRDIRRYHTILDTANGKGDGIQCKIAFNDFFIPSTYQDARNRTLPCYLCTKMGCEFIANKLTGERGILFTASYIYAFDKMRNQVFDAGIHGRIAKPSGQKINGISRFIQTMRVIMLERGAEAQEIEQMARMVCRQYGISLPPMQVLKGGDICDSLLPHGT